MHKNIKKKGGLHSEHLSLLPDGRGWLIVQFGAATKKEAKETAEELRNRLQKQHDPPSMKLLVEKSEQQNYGTFARRAWCNGIRAGRKRYLAWMGRFRSCAGKSRQATCETCASSLTNMITTPLSTVILDRGAFTVASISSLQHDLELKSTARSWRKHRFDYRYDGSFSGEHGDGQSRAEFLEKMFGSELIEAFREFKSIWDPDWKMNPGKIVDPYRIDENLRLGAEYKPWEPETHFKFPNDHGSFAHATLRCVGVGKCRRLEASGEQATMCPSFMVTREEKDTTRGRAHALFEMLQGNPVSNGWRDEGVKDALDLCLACKGCKGDCPVNVDMATYKAEFLSHYWEGRLRPRSAYAFGLIDKWAQIASVAPGLVNLMTQLPIARSFAKVMAGVPQERKIPAFAPQPFRDWLRKHKSDRRGTKRVILWPDTFNNYFFPETAIAATEVLESAGCEVIVPRRHLCCGRPLYDYGFLGLAKEYLERIFSALGTEIARGTPLVVLEPSCCSVFRDE